MSKKHTHKVSRSRPDHRRPSPKPTRRTEQEELVQAAHAARHNPDALTPAQVRRLQGVIGNQAVQRVLARTAEPLAVQRRIDWQDGPRNQTKDLVNTVLSFQDFGITPSHLNGQVFPDGGDEKQAVFGPPINLEDSKTVFVPTKTLKLSSEAANVVSYHMDLPTAPPWQTMSTVEHVVSAVGMLAPERKAELEKSTTDISGAVTLRVRGLPDDDTFADLVEQHEDHHVNDLQDVARRILAPWDRRIKSFHDENRSVTALNADKVKAKFYRQMGGTPGEKGSEMVADLHKRGDAYHHTAEGSSPILERVKVTKGPMNTITVYWRHPLG